MAIDIEAPGADEADLKAAIQALANDITVVTLSSNTTLDSTYYTKLTEVDTSAVVITFPTAPATQATLDVVNTSAGAITINGVSVAAGKTVGYISIDSAWVEITPNVAGGGSYTDDDARDALGEKPYVSGRWYIPSNYEEQNFVAGSAPQATTTMYFVPIRFRDAITIDSVAASVGTLSAGGNFKLHLYAMDATTRYPTGAPIWDSPNLSTAATGPVTAGSLSVAVTAEWYWLGFMADNTTVTFLVAGSPTTSHPNSIITLAGVSSAANALTPNAVRQYTKTGVTFGSPPTLTGDITTDGLTESTFGPRPPAITFKGA